MPILRGYLHVKAEKVYYSDAWEIVMSTSWLDGDICVRVV